MRYDSHARITLECKASRLTDANFSFNVMCIRRNYSAKGILQRHAVQAGGQPKAPVVIHTTTRRLKA